MPKKPTNNKSLYNRKKIDHNKPIYLSDPIEEKSNESFSEKNSEVESPVLVLNKLLESEQPTNHLKNIIGVKKSQPSISEPRAISSQSNGSLQIFEGWTFFSPGTSLASSMQVEPSETGLEDKISRLKRDRAKKGILVTQKEKPHSHLSEFSQRKEKQGKKILKSSCTISQLCI